MSKEKNPKNIITGERVRFCREKAGLSRLKLAEKIGENPHNKLQGDSVQIGYIEQGNRSLSEKYAKAIAQILNVRAEYLLNEDDYMTQHEYEQYLTAKNQIEELFAPHKLLKSAICAVLKQADYNINLERNVPAGYQWLDMETYKRHGINEMLGVTPETLKKITEDIPAYSHGYWIEHEGENVAWCPDAVIEQITEEIADIVKIRIQHFVEEQAKQRVKYISDRED